MYIYIYIYIYIWRPKKCTDMHFVNEITQNQTDHGQIFKEKISLNMNGDV